MSIPEVFKMYRRKCNLTQTDLAKRLDVSQPYISLIEHGKSEPGKLVIQRMPIALRRRVLRYMGMGMELEK